MTILLAILRITFMLLAMILGTLLILLLTLVPFRVRGIRLSAWPANWLARLLLWTFNVQCHATNTAALRQHRGLVMCNHLSYLDVIMLLHVLPVRFLSAAGVRSLPLIGWIASAIETVYVNRGDQASRAAARAEITEQLRANPFPPLAIFPEGKVGNGNELGEFRHGAFEIAHEGDIECLPCALWYEPQQLLNWSDVDDDLPKAIWRLAKNWRADAWITVLPPHMPEPTMDGAEMAQQIHDAISRTLNAIQAQNQ